MKTNLIQAGLLATALLALSAVGQAQFNYITNNGTVTINGYTRPGGAMTIPPPSTASPSPALKWERRSVDRHGLSNLLGRRASTFEPLAIRTP